MAKPGKTGVSRIIAAAGYSRKGLYAAFKHEAAFRQELLVLLILSPIAVWLGEGSVEYALLIGCLLLVMIAELLNSAVEAVVDRVGAEQHELSGRAKDIGSAAVFLALVNAVLIWFFVLVL